MKLNGVFLPLAVAFCLLVVFASNTVDACGTKKVNVNGVEFRVCETASDCESSDEHCKQVPYHAEQQKICMKPDHPLFTDMDHYEKHGDSRNVAQGM